MSRTLFVGFLGEKGGVGKTINAHAVAQGFAMRGIPAAYMLTDTKRELLSDEKRPYTILDGRTKDKLGGAVAKIQRSGIGGICAIDGGGGRGPVDEYLATLCDAVIFPFDPDDDTVFVVSREMREFPEAWAMPTNWPTNAKAADYDQGYIAKVTAAYPGRVLPSMPAIHSLKDLKISAYGGYLSGPARFYCTTLADRVSELLEGVNMATWRIGKLVNER